MHSYLLHISLFYRGKSPIIMQNWTALTLGPREAGISLYYPIQMPLVQPRKWKNGYTFQSVNWAGWGNAALVAFQDSCQLLRKSISAFVSEAEIDRHEPVDLDSSDASSKIEHRNYPRSNRLTLLQHVTPTPPFPAFRAAKNNNSPLAALGKQQPWIWYSKR